MNTKIIGIIVIILIALFGVYAVIGGNILSTNANDINVQKADTSNMEVTDNIIINQTQTLKNKWFTTDKSDVNTILVEDNATADIKNSAINKTGDSTGNGDSTDFYGTNAAVLVKKGSNASMDTINIFTNSTGSNAIFVTNADDNDNKQTDTGASNEMPGEPNDMSGSTGQPGTPPDGNEGQSEAMPIGGSGEAGPGMESSEDYSRGGATATVKNVEINTYKDKSRGLDATYGGIINAENVIINTRGGSCAALATDRGEGTVTANNCELNTGVDNGTGRGSPCIYSTGNITATHSKGTAYNSQIACIEGKNSITLEDCELNCFAGGNREEDGKFVDLGGFFIYQSMSGDANVGTATLNATDSKFSIDESSEHYTTAPMFHVTNTKAIINLEKCECNFGSGTLLNVSGQNQWGNTGSNGGELEFNMMGETLSGNIFIDEISSLSMNMKNSDYKGMINSAENHGNTTITLDNSSTWTLTGNSYVTSLENQGTIEYGSYTLYVNGEAYTASNPYK